MVDPKKYVSRGGLKLEHALITFGINPTGMVVLDVGSSTGGFVDCLLQHGAAKVFALDTAYGEFAWTLRNDPRVVVMERKNILDLTELPEQVDLVTIDVTFTSLSKILPQVKKFLKQGSKIVALLKPQYEESELALRHKGVIPVEELGQIVKNLRLKFEDFGFKVLDETDSPILGGSGNREYLLHIEIV